MSERQQRNRYARATERFGIYQEVAQWFAENDDNGNPLILQNFAELAQQNFRPGHDALLLGYRSDIQRKLDHALVMTPGINPWIAAFRRPADGTIYCAFVLLRDAGQNFALIKPYWFLAAGETEAGYRVAPMMAI